MSYAEVSDAETGELLGDMKIRAPALEEVEEKAELIALIDTQAAQLGAATCALQDAAVKLEELRTELERTELRALQRRAKQCDVEKAALAADKASLVQFVLAEQSPVPCPSLTGQADRRLTNQATGEPRLLFHVARLSCVLFSMFVVVLV